MKDRPQDLWVLASPDAKTFFVKGSGNTEHDGDYVVDTIREATLFERDPAPELCFVRVQKKGSKEWVTTKKRKPETYWHPSDGSRPHKEDRKMGLFMQTAIGFPVTLTLHDPNVSRLAPLSRAIKSTADKKVKK